MKYKKLSNTDLSVSLICLGTMTYGEQNNEKEAHEQLDYSLSNGINFFLIDSSERYGKVISSMFLPSVNLSGRFIGDA